jgi:hypothetical protein
VIGAVRIREILDSAEAEVPRNGDTSAYALHELVFRVVRRKLIVRDYLNY